MKIVMATGNPGKLRELNCILAPYNMKPIGLKELGIDSECPESGASFLENAMQKANFFRRLCQADAVFADDSGLEVDALDGAPGIFSARFGGLPNHDRKCDYLLDLLEDVPLDYRSARFHCAAVFMSDKGYLSAQASIEGFIGLEKRGDGGFGYDPIFYLEPEGPTLAQVPMDEKNAISHRGKAFRQLVTRVMAMGRLPTPAS